LTFFSTAPIFSSRQQAKLIGGMERL